MGLVEELNHNTTQVLDKNRITDTELTPSSVFWSGCTIPAGFPENCDLTESARSTYGSRDST